MADEVISRADARAQGLTKYFDGLECSNGHIAKRSVANGGCLACAAEVQKRYKAAHAEKIKTYAREYERNASEGRKERKRIHRAKWAKEHVEQDREIKRACRAKKPELYKAKDKRWRDANPDKIAVKNKRYKTEHAERLRPIAVERMKQWVKDNPDRARANNLHAARLRRARLAELECNFTREQLDDLFAKQKGRCAACHCKLTKRNRELDHIIAIKNDGPSVIENFQWLCRPCNRSKAAKDPYAWAQENGRLL